jgi:ferredoxin--NADP+ reductase
VPDTWPLEAESIAVIGAGNVALDVARVLAKHPKDLLSTEIPDNVYQGLSKSPVKDVHVFARRGPAQAKFSPLELRELGHVPDVDVIVYPEDFEFDEGSLAAIEATNQTKQVVKTLTDWALKDPTKFTASRRLHLHFLHAPAEVVDANGDGKVDGFRTERTKLNGDGTVSGTGEFHDWDVQAVYRAVGYFGSELPEIPYNDKRGVITNDEGRVLDLEGNHIPGLYCTGWIKRGPVGLIGHTKSDASETIRHLTEDAENLSAFATATQPTPEAITEFLAERGVSYIEWSGWQLLDEYEKALGEKEGRERIKVVPRHEQINISLGRNS